MKIKDVYPIQEFHGPLVGIELEIEGVHECMMNLIHGISKVEDDGSLREGGIEIISSPITVADAFLFFESVYNHGIIPLEGVPFHSPRTSTHVHVNVSDLSVKAVRTLIKNYFLLEPGFFCFISTERQNNIYCVPLSATTVLDKFPKASLHTLISQWHKYTAFNIKPISTLGTVEFRHLEGTDNIEVFRRWLSIIASWRKCTFPLNTFEEVLLTYEKVFSGVPSAEIQQELLENFLTLQTIMNSLDEAVLSRRIEEKLCVA